MPNFQNSSPFQSKISYFNACLDMPLYYEDFDCTYTNTYAAKFINTRQTGSKIFSVTYLYIKCSLVLRWSQDNISESFNSPIPTTQPWLLNTTWKMVGYNFWKMYPRKMGSSPPPNPPKSAHAWCILGVGYSTWNATWLLQIVAVKPFKNCSNI